MAGYYAFHSPRETNFPLNSDLQHFSRLKLVMISSCQQKLGPRYVCFSILLGLWSTAFLSRQGTMEIENADFLYNSQNEGSMPAWQPKTSPLSENSTDEPIGGKTA